MSEVATAAPPSASPASDSPSETPAGSHPNYWAIFLALCGLTGLSWLLDESLGWGLLSSPVLVVVGVLAVSTAKALFVVTYFMHLKFEGRWKYVLLTPTVILAAGLPLSLAPDLSLRYYPADTAQSRYLDETQTAEAASTPYKGPVAEAGDTTPEPDAAAPTPDTARRPDTAKRPDPSPDEAASEAGTGRLDADQTRS